MLGVLIAISELWRRPTIRYIQDVSRRFQFLLRRRIVVAHIKISPDCRRGPQKNALLA